MSPAIPSSPFARFEPQSPTALATAQALVRAGARVLRVSRTHIELQRLESIARIDQAGRVEWRAAEPVDAAGAAPSPARPRAAPGAPRRKPGRSGGAARTASRLAQR